MSEELMHVDNDVTMFIVKCTRPSPKFASGKLTQDELYKFFSQLKKMIFFIILLFYLLILIFFPKESKGPEGVLFLHK